MLMPDLEIGLLRAFIAVAEAGSFTAAAPQVGRSQSAVSQKVLRLEEILECRVFDRTSRSLQLTKDGERVLAVARRMLSINDAAMRELRGGPSVGRFRLGVAEDLLPRHLPKLLNQFCRSYPGIQLDLVTGLSCELLAAYDDRRVDAVVAKKDGTAQRGRVFWREPLVWFASAEYDFDADKPTELVMLRPPCTYRQLMIASMDSIRHEWSAACTANSLMAVQAAVAAGLGLTIMGRSFVQPTMRALKTPEHWPPLPMTEITVLGEDTLPSDFLEPLLRDLLEDLSLNT